MTFTLWEPWQSVSHAPPASTSTTSEASLWLPMTEVSDPEGGGRSGSGSGRKMEHRLHGSPRVPGAASQPGASPVKVIYMVLPFTFILTTAL